VLVVIVAKRFGWIPPDPQNDQGRSITWLECDQAVKDGKEVLAFLIDESAPWPLELSEEWAMMAAIREGTASPELLSAVQLWVAKLREFKQWLSAGRVRRTFVTAEDLHRQIFHALVDWKRRKFSFETTGAGLIYQPKPVDQDPGALVAQGIALAASRVRNSFGPRGHLVTSTDAGGRVRVLKRGSDIVRAIAMPDKFRQMGITLMADLADQVASHAGDGGKTSILIAGTLIELGLQRISEGVSPLDFSNGLERGGRVIASLLELQARPAKDDALQRLAATAAHGDELSKPISDAIEAAGDDGAVVLERDLGTSAVRIDHQKGYVMDAGYVSTLFLPTHGPQFCHFHDAVVLVSDLRLTAVRPLLGLLEQVALARKPFLIIASAIEGEVLQTLTLNAIRGTLPCVAVRIPGTDSPRQNRLSDLAIMTGAQVVTEALGHSITGVKLEHLGRAAELLVSETQTTFFPMPGLPADLPEYLARLRSAITNTKDAFSREKLQERLANLAGRIVRVHVGGVTESELGERLYKAESAMHSSRSGSDQGYLLGGGKSLMMAKAGLAQQAAKDPGEAAAFAALLRALEEPARALAHTCGQDPDATLRRLESDNAVFDVSTSDVLSTESCALDSLVTVRAAVMSAVSLAKSVIRTRTWATQEGELTSDLLDGFLDSPSGN
jgi:chaperonin GroEL